MAWTTPRDWTTGELVTASIMNVHVRDNLKWLGTDSFYKKLTAKDVSNTTSETDLLNGEITIAAGAMGTSRILKCVAAGDALDNTASPETVAFKIKFGGTTFWGDTETLGVTAAARYPWRIEFEIVNLGAANAQTMNGFFSVGNNTAPTTGLGDLDVANQSATPIGTSADQAIDTSSAQALAITAQFATANINLSCRLKYFYAVILGV